MSKSFYIDKKFFYRGQPVYDILLLVWVGVAKFLPKVIHKNSAFSQAGLYKDYQLGLGESHHGFGFHFLLMLLPLVQSSLFDKNGDKKSLVAVSRVRHGKKVILLLDKLVTIYMQLTLLNLRRSGFESMLWRILRSSLILATSNKRLYFLYCFKNPIKIIFSILKNWRGGQAKTRIWELKVWRFKKLLGLFITVWAIRSGKNRYSHGNLALIRALAFFLYGHSDICKPQNSYLN